MSVNLGVASLEAVLDTIVPAGTVIAFAGETVPAGWLLCDGQTVSRSTYARLFSAIGEAHGNGDGATTFHVPDYRGRFLRGVDGGAGNDPDATSRSAANTGGNTGDSVGSVQADQFKSHGHIQTASAATGGSFEALGQNGRGGTTASAASTAASGGNETRPKNANVNYLIRI